MRIDEQIVYNTNQKIPLLKGFGPFVHADYAISDQYNGINYEILGMCKVYIDQKDLKRHRYLFLGNSLYLQMDILDTEVYLYSGKPFRKPQDSCWIKNKKIKRCSVWSKECSLSDIEYECIKKTVEWLEREVCVSQSYRYAVCFKRNYIQAVFWEPDLNTVDAQIHFIEEALDSLNKLFGGIH